MSASGPGVFDDDLACDVRDTYRRYADGQDLRHHQPRGMFAVLDAAGRDVHLEQPCLTGLLLREWLTRIETYGDGHAEGWRARNGWRTSVPSSLPRQMRCAARALCVPSRVSGGLAASLSSHRRAPDPPPDDDPLRPGLFPRRRTTPSSAAPVRSLDDDERSGDALDELDRPLDGSTYAGRRRTTH